MSSKNVLTEEKLIEFAVAQLSWKFAKDGLTPRIVPVQDSQPRVYRLEMEVGTNEM
jgi:hypothetical protein